MLVERRKFDFRIYMLVASTDPYIVYYHDGFLRVSLENYDPNSNDKGVHLTNTEFSKKKWHDMEKNGINTEELREYQMWNLTRFQNYLLE